MRRDSVNRDAESNSTSVLRSIDEMKLWRLFAVISLLFLQVHYIEAKPWRGIEPLHSTRADVERLMGSKVVRCGGSACIYDLGEEAVFVLYATDCSCKNNDS